MGWAEAAGWIAPGATMAAACMTAANLGARVTGWGFVVFAIGSCAWTIVALATDQPNLLWTNAFLLAVNALGVWRWLGRQARYADGGQAAAKVSAGCEASTLAPVGALTGARLVGRHGETVGVVVDAMLRCDDHALDYVVVSEGGVGGLGEALHAIPAAALSLGVGELRIPLDQDELSALPTIAPDAWPASASEIAWPADRRATGR